MGVAQGVGVGVRGAQGDQVQLCGGPAAGRQAAPALRALIVLHVLKDLHALIPA
jgi:hypothetical protein